MKLSMIYARFLVLVVVCLNLKCLYSAEPGQKEAQPSLTCMDFLRVPSGDSGSDLNTQGRVSPSPMTTIFQRVASRGSLGDVPDLVLGASEENPDYWNGQDENGNTFLHNLVISRKMNSKQLAQLLETGAFNLSIRNDNGESVKDLIDRSSVLKKGLRHYNQRKQKSDLRKSGEALKQQKQKPKKRGCLNCDVSLKRVAIVGGIVIVYSLMQPYKDALILSLVRNNLVTYGQLVRYLLSSSAKPEDILNAVLASGNSGSMERCFL